LLHAKHALTGPLTRIVCVQAWAQGSVIASVCHGPAALVRVKDPASGELLLRGKRVACFTNEEEMAVGMVDAVPFLLEDAVKKAGATHELAKAWCAIRDAQSNAHTGASPCVLTRRRHMQECARGARWPPRDGPEPGVLAARGHGRAGGGARPRPCAGCDASHARRRCALS
jgi:hypothetical protein